MLKFQWYAEVHILNVLTVIVKWKIKYVQLITSRK